MMYVCDKILTDVLIMVLITFNQIFKFSVKKSIVRSSSDILDVIAFMNTQKKLKSKIVNFHNFSSTVL